MDTQITVILVLLAVFLGLSAFFSSAETAFFALQRVRVHHLEETGDPRARRVARLKADPEKFLATILLGNNVVNVALSALATSVAISLIGDDRQGISVAVAIGIVTVAVVILGEAAPKTIAARHPESVLFLYLRPLEVVERVLFPAATLLRAVSAFITRPFGTRGHAPLVSEEELQTMVRVGATEGVVEETQAEIIHKAFQFGDLRGQEIMTPRTEIIWVPKGATLAEFLGIYANETHTRFPVYDEELDNVLGILFVKDVLKSFAEGRLGDSDPIVPLMRPAYFYPESKPVDDLFAEMRNEGTQLVMLVDEFGGIAGLLTLKQVVGEIVGSITEEEEGEEPAVETIDERTLQVDASMRVDEANERLSLAIPDGDYETLAGFVLASLGHIPVEGEQVRHNGLRLVVAEMKGIKIERILVRKV